MEADKKYTYNTIADIDRIIKELENKLEKEITIEKNELITLFQILKQYKERKELMRSMSVPFLKIRDKDYNTIHIFGTNEHDALRITDDGKLEYYNFQSGPGDYFEIIPNEESKVFGYNTVDTISIDKYIDIKKESRDERNQLAKELATYFLEKEDSKRVVNHKLEEFLAKFNDEMDDDIY